MKTEGQENSKPPPFSETKLSNALVIPAKTIDRGQAYLPMLDFHLELTGPDRAEESSKAVSYACS